jgi:predicted O-methyltransferase YrrM
MSDDPRRGWEAVDRYLTRLLVPADPVLEAALEASARAGLPAIQITPIQGRLLELLARAVGARDILEIGTLGGYSTIWLARTLPPGGRLVTMEIEPRHLEVARANVERAGLSGVVDFRLGPARETIRRLAAEGRQFDLIFLDADRPGYPDYFRAAMELSHPGTLLVADNVVRNGLVADGSSDDPQVAGVRRYLELMAAEPRVVGTVLQTVGEKGHDGLAIGLVIG